MTALAFFGSGGGGLGGRQKLLKNAKMQILDIEVNFLSFFYYLQILRVFRENVSGGPEIFLSGPGHTLVPLSSTTEINCSLC